MNAAISSPNPPTAVDWRLAHRLLCASNLAYGVTADTSTSGILASAPPVLPSREIIAELLMHSGLDGGSLQTYQTGGSGIDAFLYGETDEAAILAFRGTLPVRLASEPGRLWQIITDWTNNAKAVLVDGARFGLPGAVHAGFGASLEALWSASGGLQRVFPRVCSAAAQGKKFLITGHSKGGALACLAALRLAGTGTAALMPGGVYMYAAPRTGNHGFAEAFIRAFPDRAWRFEFQDDVVPQLPPSEEFWSTVRETLMRLTNDYKGRGEALSPASPIAVRGVPNRVGAYQSAGRLQLLDWEGNLIEEDTPALRAERLRRLARALIVALPEVSKAHLPMQGFGYMTSIARRMESRSRGADRDEGH
ncbi:MAG: hypothetical protein MUF20_04575 [Methylotetracoccus sp.]|jgi:hypothetical protein|nr:hypothetical protein [Methylotetracoccus sp.]